MPSLSICSQSLSRSALPYLPERAHREKRNQSLIIHILTLYCSLGRANGYDNQETYKNQGKRIESFSYILVTLIFQATGQVKRSERGRKKFCSFFFFHCENSEHFCKLTAIAGAYLSTVVACLLKL